MTILTITVAYIINVFLARWLNKKLVEIDGFYRVSPMTWFIPIGGVMAELILLLVECFSVERKTNWFTGKYWK